MKSRYTIDGSRSLESMLDTICEASRKALLLAIPEDSLKGIALGGGYGRGEGGVFRERGEELPYNDVEFFVFVSRNRFLARRKWGETVTNIGHELTEQFGIEVEFRIIGTNEIQQAPPSMFYYDLIMGHRWILGGDSLLRNCEHHRDPSALQYSEATRLLMNRASGLLFARKLLETESLDEKDSDFIFRNIRKAQLATGDAILTSRGGYHWSCVVRHERLNRLAIDTAILRDHQVGLSFKLHPFRTSLCHEKLTDLHRSVSHRVEMTFLEIESKRLGHEFTDSGIYIKYEPKVPTSPRLRNRMINFRDRGLPGLLDTSHPRESFLNFLCFGLWNAPEKTLNSNEMERFHLLWKRCA